MSLVYETEFLIQVCSQTGVWEQAENLLFRDFRVFSGKKTWILDIQIFNLLLTLTLQIYF